VRPNPKKLNALQLRTLAILQAIARQPDFADPPHQDGTVSLHTLPHRHGDHLHVGAAVASLRHYLIVRPDRPTPGITLEIERIYG
jgi:hypothetical protein